MLVGRSLGGIVIKKVQYCPTVPVLTRRAIVRYSVVCMQKSLQLVRWSRFGPFPSERRERTHRIKPSTVAAAASNSPSTTGMRNANCTERPRANAPIMGASTRLPNDPIANIVP